MPIAKKYVPGSEKPKSIQDQLLDIANQAGVKDLDVVAAYADGVDPNEIVREVHRRSLRSFEQKNQLGLDVDAAFDDGVDPEEISKELNRRAEEKYRAIRKKNADAYKAEAAAIDTRPLEYGLSAESIKRQVSDYGTTFGAGLAGLAGLAGKGVGLLTGNMDNAIVREAESAQKFYRDRFSPELKAAQAEAREEVEQAKKEGKGQVGQGVAAVRGMVKNPMTLLPFVAENAPMVVPGMGVARAAGALGAGAKVVTGLAVGTGAAMQGASVGGDTYDELMAPEMDSWWELVPEVQEAAPEERQKVREEIALSLSRRSAAAGTALSLLTSLIPGGKTVERVTAGAGRKVMGGVGAKLSKATVGVVGEALQEGAEELSGKMSSNLAVGQIDESRGIMEGTGEATALGALGGVGMGGPTSVGEAFFGAEEKTNDAGQESKAPPAPKAPKTEGSTTLTGDDPVSARNIAARKAKLDQEFDSVVKANPAIAPAVDSWRKENPLGTTEDFHAELADQEAAATTAQAAADPRVIQAQAAADEASQKLQDAQAVAANPDPTAPPPPGFTPEDLRNLVKDGTGALEQQAQAAAEHVRTVEQTVAKESETDKAGEVQDKSNEQIKKDQKDAQNLLKETQAAVLAGAVEFDPVKLTEMGVAAGLTPDAAATRVATIQKKLQDKAGREQGENGGSTPSEAPIQEAASGQVGVPAPTAEGVLGEQGSGAPPPFIFGNEHEALTARGKAGKYRLAVVPMASLKTSDMEGYPQEVQPRDRTRYSSNETVRRIGKDLKPALLMPTPSVTDGPPVVGPDGVVEGGNGRVMGMRLAAKGKSAGWDSYQQEIRSKAQEMGIDPAALEGVTDPVVVRVRNFEVGDRAEFARELNESVTNAMDATAQSVSDASRLSPIMGLLSDEAESLSDSDNDVFMAAFIERVVPEAERPALRGKEGKPNAQALTRAMAAIFAKAYGSAGGKAFDRVAYNAVEEMDPDGLNIIAAMRMAAPLISKLGDMVARGERGDLDIAPEIVAAVDRLNDLRSRGISLGAYLQQAEADMFGAKDSEEVAAVTRTIDSMKRSARKVAETFKEYARLALATSDPNQGDVFAAAPPTKLDIWRIAAKEVVNAAGIETPAPAPALESGDAESVGEDRPVAPPADPEGARVESGIGSVGNRLLLDLRNGVGLPKDNNALKAMVKEIDGEAPGTHRMKQAQEELETAIAIHSRGIASTGLDSDEVFRQLLALYESQPILGIRTSTSLANQAYSTPAPLAYLSNLLAGVDQSSLVYEPTAGNGLLLINVEPANVTVNELDPERFARLQPQGFGHVRNGDALTAGMDGLVADSSQDAIVTNPPFGPIIVDGENQVRVVDGYKIKQIDHLIAMEALRAMKPDGRATLIIGAGKEPAEVRPSDRIFFNWLYSKYNVVDHFEVDGDLYRRQGAGWPVRIISIHGRVDSKNLSPEPGVVPRFSSWEDVHAHVKTVLGSSGFQRIPDPAPRVQGSVEGAGDGKPGATAPGIQAGGAGKEGGAQGGPGRGQAVPGAGGAGVVDSGPGRDSVGPGGVAGSVEPPVDGGLEGVDGGRGVRGDGAGDVESGADVRRGGGDDRVELVDRGIVAVKPDEIQTNYAPSSHRTDLDSGILVPTNMAQAHADAMYDLQRQVGGIDAYVTKELGYSSVEELQSAFMGVQTDAIASAIFLAKRGKGVVIADQTGIGKGRMAAAMIRWAKIQGKMPVFVSVKPALFTTMHEDLNDIGTNDVTPFVMNEGEKVYARDGKTVVFESRPKDRRALLAAESIEDLQKAGKNAIFMTYSQVNIKNKQQDLLKRIAADSFFILDESHNAAGDSATGSFFQGILPESFGTTYLSATWAKRSDNLPVYMKTDVGSLGMDAKQLQSAMIRGGYALQTLIAASLARAGQMFRRERSFEGIDFKTVQLKERRAQHQYIADQITAGIRAIVSADKAFHRNQFKKMEKAVKDANKDQTGTRVVMLAGNSVSSVSHAQFSSVAHNLISQMALGMKADALADEAIDALNNKEAPVITLESTMGSFLKAFSDENGIAVGDELGSFDWRNILYRALERSRYMVIEDEFGVKSRVPVPMSDLDPGTRALYLDAERLIGSLDISIPVSPIDWIRHRLTQAGHRVVEITGRELTVDYSDPKRPKLAPRIDMKADHSRLVKEFNEGKQDVVIFNVSGATGISMHADKRWTDQNNKRPRRMIVGQPFKDINLFMQALGRVNRTGQIVPPSYKMLNLDLPMETRPAAVLAKKLKSLNANTTSNTEGNTKIEAVDVINIYGDEVVRTYLEENPEMAADLDVDMDSETLAQDATGHLAILPVAVQEQFWEDVTPRYNALIDYLNETGQNKLVRRTMDFKAKELSRSTLYPSNDKGGVFSGPADYVEMECRVTGRPMTVDEAKKRMDESLGGKTPAMFAAELLQKAETAYLRFVKTIPFGSGRINVVESMQRQFKIAPPPTIGSTYSVETPSGNVSGVVVDVVAKIEEAGNPYAASKYTIVLATNNPSSRIMRVPLSKWDTISTRIVVSMEDALASDGMVTERRKFVVGNIFGAFTQLKESVSGEVISMTLENGETIDALALPKTFNAKEDTVGTVDVNPQEGLKILARIAGTSDPKFTSKDGLLTAMIGRNGSIALQAVDTSRRTVMKLTAQTGVEFANGKASLSPAQFQELLGKIDFTAELESLEEVGLMKEGKFDPAGFARPESIETIKASHVRAAAAVIGARDWEVSQVLESLNAWNRSAGEMADMTRDLESLASSIESGEMPMKKVRETLRRISAKGSKSGASHLNAASLQRVGSFLARAVLMKKAEGKRSSQPVYPGLFSEPAFNSAFSRLYPFIIDPRSEEGKSAIQHALWVYAEKKGEEPNLATPSGRRAFTDYLTAEVTLHANPMSGPLAWGLGLAAGFAVAPGMTTGVVAALGARFAMKMAVKAWDRLAKKVHSGRSRIIGANSVGGAKGWKVVDMLDQIYLRGIEIAAPAQAVLREMQKMAKETGLPQEQIGEMLADFLEGNAPLPAELQGLGDRAKMLNAHFAKKLTAVGGKTLPDFFHRVYDFEGLQALKDDQAALQAVAMDVRDQIKVNDPQRVQDEMKKHGVTEDEAAYALALASLEAMYDGSEEAKRKDRVTASKERERFITKLLTPSSGAAPSYELYRKISDKLRNRLAPFSASGTKKRQVSFQLPKEVTLSNGETVRLIDRDFFSVYPKYVDDMARSLAQKELLDKTMVNSFLEGIGPVDHPERMEVTTFIKNDLSHHTERSFESERTRAAVTLVKNANSIRYLALSIWYPVRNILFGSALSLALTGPVPWLRAGVKLAQALVPGIRKAPIDQATLGGAVMQSIVDDHLGGAGQFGRIVTAPMLYSQQAVDVGGFYAGRYFAPKVFDRAVKGDKESSDLLLEALGQKGVDEALLRGGLDEQDLDRFGLVYRNMISGTGRNLNLPSFMGTEMGKFIFQFSSIPMEQTKILVDRILGTKREAGYWAGAAFAGTVLGAMAYAALLVKERDDDDEKLLDYYENWQDGGAVSGKILYGLSQSGSLQKFGPIWMAITPSPSGKLPLAERIVLSSAGLGPTLSSGVGLMAATGKGAIEARDEMSQEDPDIIAAAERFAGPVLRNLVNDQQSFIRSMGIKMGKLEAEEK